MSKKLIAIAIVALLVLGTVASVMAGAEQSVLLPQEGEVATAAPGDIGEAVPTELQRPTAEEQPAPPEEQPGLQEEAAMLVEEAQAVPAESMQGENDAVLAADALTADEINADVNGFFPTFAFDNSVNSVNAGEELWLTMRMGVNHDAAGDGAGKVFKNLQLRVYFGEAFSFLDTENMQQWFNYPGKQGKAELHVDGSNPANSYLAFDMDELSYGILQFDFPVNFKEGITPDGKPLNLDAQIYYKGNEPDYTKIEGKSAEKVVAAKANLSWSAKATVSPSSKNDLPLTSTDYSGPFTYTVNVNNNKLAPMNTAEEFYIKDILTVDPDLGLKASDIAVSMGNAPVSGATVTELGGGKFEIAFTYTPKANQADNNFSYKIAFNTVRINPSFPETGSRTIVLQPVLSVKGVNADEPKDMQGTPATLTLTRLKPDESIDPKLAASLKIEKTLQNAAPAEGFADGGEVQFSVGTSFGEGISPAVAVNGLAITDGPFDSSLIPKTVSVGSYTAGGVAISPQNLLITYKDGATQTIAVTAGQTIDLAAGLNQDQKNIKLMSLQFADGAKTPFVVVSKPVFAFTVDAKKPVDKGYTMENRATTSFTYARSGYSAKPYTVTTTATAQLAENKLPKTSLSKTVKNITQPGATMVSPGETLQYTITYKNLSAADSGRLVKNPIFTDIMPTKYFKHSSLQVQSVNVTITNAETTAVLTDTSMGVNQYTSYTENAPGAGKSTIKWGFDGNLAGGDSITIVYTVQAKTIAELGSETWPTNSEDLKNYVWVNDETAGIGLPGKTYGERPYVAYDLEIVGSVPVGGGAADPADQSQFKSSQQRLVTFEMTVKNQLNTFDGSKDIKQLVLVGKLPKGFAFEGGDDSSFHVDTAGYTVTVTGDTFRVEKLATGGGAADLANVLAVNNTLKVTFKATTPTEADGDAFTGQSTQFPVQARLYVWDSMDTGASGSHNYTLRNLNGVDGNGSSLYRYDAVEGGDVTFKTDDGDWYGEGTSHALQATRNLIGTLEAPIVSLQKLASGGDYRPGMQVTYTLVMRNYSTTALDASTMQNLFLEDVLPAGQEYVDDSVSGSTGGAITADVSGKNIKFDLPADFSLVGTLGTNGAIQAGEYRITYKAVVGTDYMDGADAWAGSTTVTNKAAMVFGGGAENSIYKLSSDGKQVEKLDDPDAADGWYWARAAAAAPAGAIGPKYAVAYDKIVKATADVLYTRDRISPEITKTIVNEPAIKKNGTSVNWQIVAGNNGSYAGTSILNPYIIDVLPAKLTYKAGSAKIAGAAAADPTIVPNGTTNILVWKLGRDIPRGQSVTISYGTTVTLNAVSPEYNLYTNAAYLLPQASQQAIFAQNTSGGAIKGSFVGDVRTPITPKTLADLGVEDYATETPKAMEAKKEIGIWGEANISYFKSATFGNQTVQSTDENRARVVVPLGENFSNTLHINNGSLGQGFNYEKLVIVDRLPYVDDTAVVGTQERDSEYRPLLAGDITVSSTKTVGAYTIWYQTDKNAVYDSVLWDSTTAAVPAGWTDTEPALEDIYGFRIVYSAPLVPGEQLTVNVPMHVPDTLEFPVKDSNEYTAWNSFAFGTHVKANDTSGINFDLTGIEAPKVGAQVKDTKNATMVLTKTVLDVAGNNITKTAGRSFNVQIDGPNSYRQNLILGPGNNFTATLKRVPLGVYTITEGTDQSGMQIQQTYNVMVRKDGVQVQDGQVPVLTLPEEEVKVDIVNQEKPGSINITKTLDTGAAHNGIGFQLKDKTGSLVASGTTANGGKLSFGNLAWGQYTLVEASPAGYVPVGFTKSADQTGAAPNTYYEKRISIPQRDGNNYSADVSLGVLNTMQSGIVALTKTWNGGASAPTGAATDLYLVKKGESFNENTAIRLVKNQTNIYASDTVLAGVEYDVYELTSSPYAADGWNVSNSSYYKPGDSQKYTLYKAKDCVKVAAQGNTVELKLNNSYTPPVSVFKLTYHDFNADLSGTQMYNAEEGDVLASVGAVPTIAVDTGYKAVGWFTARTGGMQIDPNTATMPNMDLDLYARRVADGYTLTYVIDGVIKAQYKNVKAGVVLRTAGAEPNTAKADYIFTGWFDAQSGGQKWEIDSAKMPKSDLTLYARYKKDVPPTPTPVPPTPTPVPPTPTPVPPTQTPVPPTQTPVPPTQTPVPPTQTPVPPTTTPAPPTATPVPPTQTPAPPTQQPTQPPVQPTTTPGGGGGGTDTGGETPQPPSGMSPEDVTMAESQSGNLIQDIADGKVPLGNMQANGVWSLLNLIVSIAALAIAIVVFVTIFLKKRKKDENEMDTQRQRRANAYAEEEEQSSKKRSLVLKILTIVSGLLVGILFLILEDITLPVVFVDNWTPLIVGVFIAHLVILIVQVAVKRNKNKDEAQPQGGQKGAVTQH